MEAGDVPESEVNMNTAGDDAQPVAEESTTIENPTASAEQQSADSKKTSSRHKHLELSGTDHLQPLKRHLCNQPTNPILPLFPIIL